MPYPDAIDSFPTVANDTPATNTHRDLENAQSAAIVNIENTLGLDPAGDAATVAELLQQILTSLVPAGVIMAYGGASAPAGGYLICDGTAVSRTTYAALFAAIGTAYGAGDGTSTFGLPNLKGKIPVGRDAAQTEFDTLGESGGAKAITLSTAQIPAHSHAITDPGHFHTYVTPFYSMPFTNSIQTDGSYSTVGGNTGVATTGISINNAGGGGAHDNLQPYQVVNYIIKT